MFDAESILAKYGLVEPPDPVEPTPLGHTATTCQAAVLNKLDEARAAFDILTSLVRTYPDRSDLINGACADLVRHLHQAGVEIERLRPAVECAGEA